MRSFSRSAIEPSGHQQVVQYRGSILPLLQLSGIVEERRRRPRAAHSKPAQSGGDRVPVVVHARNGRSVGLLVDRILDIVEDDLSTRRPSTRKGMLGSVVIQGKVTEMLDLGALIRARSRRERMKAASAV